MHLNDSEERRDLQNMADEGRRVRQRRSEEERHLGERNSGGRHERSAGRVRGGRRGRRGRRELPEETVEDGEETEEDEGYGVDFSSQLEANPITEEELNLANVMKSNILLNSSWRSYSTYLANFAFFLAERKLKEYFVDEFWNSMTRFPIDKWKRFAKDYVLQKPRPPTPMFRLDRITPAFKVWISQMKRKDGGFVSNSTYKTCRSAVAALFTLFEEPSQLFDTETASVIHGLKINHSESAGRGEMSVKRGKDPLSFEAYCRIAEGMMKRRDVNSVVSHAVLTTMWNLMCRVGNAVSICKSHLQWSEDALLIYFAHEKTDHTQSKPGDPRHIYANPYQPAICPILSLGIFFLVVDVTSSAASKTNYVFSGRNQYGRFQKSLLTRYVEEEMLGHGLASFGTHSIRKGAATYASSGSTACPPYTAISNRAGWIMPGVSSIYIQYQAASDQYVGRTVCGLNSLDPSFAVLPPRFVEGYDKNALLEQSFIGFDGASAELKKVLEMTTASVIYHMDWLRQNLPPDHCLFSTALFTKNLTDGKSDMVTCSTWKPGDVLRASGIPPHVFVLLHTRHVAETVDALPDRVAHSIDQMLDERQGDRQVTSEDIKNCVSQAFTQTLQALGYNPLPREQQQHVEQPRQSLPQQLYLTEKNRFTRLPPDFSLPSGTVKTAWICYFCWDTNKGIPPLRAVHGIEMRRSLASRFTRYKKFMEAIVSLAKEQNVWEEPKDLSHALKVFDRIDWSQLFPATSPKNRVRRFDQLSWSTLANDYYKIMHNRKLHDLSDHDEL